ncbi:MAG: GNAT family N-acetyltransferase [Actinomycetota bacterium]|nr:GNAT family N-acetyltransferase [Actinomycetota bacterium]
MPVYRPASPADDDAHELLRDYFGMRTETFPDGLGAYHTVFPDPGQFVPPAGVFLVVDDELGAVGCGGVRMLAPLSSGVQRAEVKHLYLRDRARGKGWGRELLAELEARAVGLGAREIVLDTNASLEAAQGLYRTTGYVDIPPYNENPNATNWFAKQLVGGDPDPVL